MAKKLEFELRGVRAVADLFEDRAPRTVAAVWKALREPIERDTYHSIWSGKEVFFYIPDTDRDVPLENHSTWCEPGELFWFHMPARALKVRGQTPELRQAREIFEIAIIYGQSNFRIMGEDGWRGNIFGEIVENRERFFQACGEVLDRGIQTIKVRRLEERE
jgi:hypothetical protein